MTHNELIIDNFAGGGGASTGIEMAVGHSVDIAINHDPDAIKMHKANHPTVPAALVSANLPEMCASTNNIKE